MPSSLPSGYLIFNGYIVGGGANLTNADLSNLSMPSTNLIAANFTGANLMDADLDSDYIYNTSLSSANLTGANLSHATLDIVPMTAANWPAPI